MATKNLSIETGVVEYTLNDSVTVRFNPTDMTFVEQMFSTFEELDKRQEEYKAEIDAAQSNADVFDISRRMDAEMRESIDGLFQAPVCEALVGEVNIYALAGGLPIWANLMLSLLDEVDDSFSEQQKMQNPRLQKYMKKYKAKK